MATRHAVLRRRVGGDRGQNLTGSSGSIVSDIASCPSLKGKVDLQCTLYMYMYIQCTYNVYTCT